MINFLFVNTQLISQKAALWSRLYCFCCIGLGIFITGCTSFRAPSSVYPGLYSTTTGLQNLNPETGLHQPGFDDFEAIKYRASACPRDTSHVLQLSWPAIDPKSHILPIGPPGGILLTKSGWNIDEAEVPNLEWKRYQQQLAAAGTDITATQLSAAALPVPDYFTNPFYNYYPVVGVSYDQVVAFCKWRGRVVTQAINQSYSVHPKKRPVTDSMAAEYTVVECRLPTEAEWEVAALGGRGLPYGSRCTEAPIEVNPKAAAYLKQRSGSTASVAQIRADIVAYNQHKPVRSFINYSQPEPYFLQLAVPAYVYIGPTNDYKVYNLLGNAAEMVQERGITKGGGYLDPLTACTIKARGTYTSPASTVGFRCITRALRPNWR